MSSNPDADSHVSKEVQAFVEEFARAIGQRDVDTLHELYERRFTQLTKEEFQQVGRVGHANFRPFKSWPQLGFVKRWLGSGAAAELLYQFVYFKHLFTDRNVKLEAARLAWEHSGAMLDALLAGADRFDVPNGLLWDAFDEMLYQLTIAHQKKYLKYNSAGIWGIADVTKRLQRFVDESGVMKDLADVEAGKTDPEALFASGVGHTRRAGGVFALVTLMRIDVLLGDYTSALRRCTPLALPSAAGKRLLLAVPAAHISLHYHVGFAYMMLRRYVDAAKMYRAALAVKAVGRSFSDRLQRDTASLLSMTAVLGGFAVDDIAGFFAEQSAGGNPRDLREQSQADDEAALIAGGDADFFREVFERVSPKFLSIATVSHATYVDHTGAEGKNLQARVFEREVLQHLDVIRLRGYFRVYRNTTPTKVHTLLRGADESGGAAASAAAGADGSSSEGLAALFAMKHKARQLVHDGVSPDLLSGTFRAQTTLDFVADTDRVAVVEATPAKTIEAKFAERIAALNQRTSRLAAKAEAAAAKRAAELLEARTKPAAAPAAAAPAAAAAAAAA